MKIKYRQENQMLYAKALMGNLTSQQNNELSLNN